MYRIVCFGYRFPTPVCVVLSAAVFAFAHLTPDQFPQLFVLGNFLRFRTNAENHMDTIFVNSAWTYVVADKLGHMTILLCGVLLLWIPLLGKPAAHGVLPPVESRAPIFREAFILEISKFMYQFIQYQENGGAEAVQELTKWYRSWVSFQVSLSLRNQIWW